MKLKAEWVFIGAIVIYSIIVTYKLQNTKQELNNRSVRNIHMIDSLNGVNAERQRQIQILQKQLDDNYENYQSTLHSIDSLDRNGLRRQMRKLLTDITGQDSE
jgi:hypothetical protein